MKEAIIMGIGVLFIMASFTPFVLSIITKEYGKEFKHYITSYSYENSINNKIYICVWENTFYLTHEVSTIKYICSPFITLPLENNMRIQNIALSCSIKVQEPERQPHIDVIAYALTKEQYENFKDGWSKLTENSSYENVLSLFRTDEYIYLGTAWFDNLENYWENTTEEGYFVAGGIYKVNIPAPTNHNILLLMTSPREFWHDIYIYPPYALTYEGNVYRKLYGYVYDRHKKPLENVEVSTETSWDITDNAGYYEILIPENTFILVTFKKEGYVTATKEVKISQDTRMDVTLEKIPSNLWDYIWWWIKAKTMYFALFVAGCFMITIGYITERRERMIRWR